MIDTSTCPKCGTARIASDYQGAFECGTMIDSGKQYYHTGTCKDFAELRKPLDAERDQLLQTVKRLEEEVDYLRDRRNDVAR